MDSLINFSFRDKMYSAGYVISENAYPTYIYISFRDEELVKEFGEEVCIHTDGSRLLTDHVYTDNRLHLYTSVFESIARVASLRENRETAQ